MIGSDPTLFDTFEVKGYWWLPDTPDHKVPGILSYNAGNTELELFGWLRPQTIVDMAVVSPPFRPEIIIGQGNGRYYTLFKNYETSTTLSVPGTDGSSQFKSNIVFSGLRFDSPEDFRFLSATMSFSNLENWLHQEAIFRKDTKENDVWIHRREYRHPEPFKVDLPELNAKYLRKSFPGHWPNILAKNT